MTTDMASISTSFDGAAGFNFWLGDWNCEYEGGRGTNTITKILRGHVIFENFSCPELDGQSFSVFKEEKQVWLQTWVDDSNNYLLFIGRREPESMVLDGRYPDGSPTGLRMVWDRITPTSFSWAYQKQQIDGEWKSEWSIKYRRRQVGTPLER